MRRYRFEKDTPFIKGDLIARRDKSLCVSSSLIVTGINLAWLLAVLIISSISESFKSTSCAMRRMATFKLPACCGVIDKEYVSVLPASSLFFSSKIRPLAGVTERILN